jgi:hypothetical protein
VIYFLRREPDRLIKIGRTRDLRRRLRALERQYGPLAVLAVADESRHREAALHRLFSSLWVEGEWFAPGADLMAFIATHGRPWDETRDAPPVPVLLPAALVATARVVAEIGGLPVPELIAGILEGPLAKMEVEALGARARAVGLDPDSSLTKGRDDDPQAC